MKTRKFSFGHRSTTTIFILLFGVFAPIGCAQTPKNLFSKVWGPDRVTFKEAVGLGDSRSKKKSNTLFSDQLANKSSEFADNDRKTFGQKISDFGKVLIPGFNRSDKNDKSVMKTASVNPRSKTRNEDPRKRLALNNKPNADSALRNPGKTSAAETLRKNRIRNNLKTNKNPTQSLYASRPAEGRNSLDKSRTNPFAESLDTQNPNQSRRSVESASTKRPDNTLAQSENPFADLSNQMNQKPVKEFTASPSSNQFVAEFDDSWEKILREQEPFADKDESDETDELDELDELDEFDETKHAESLAFSSFGNTGSNETTSSQESNLSRREDNREYVDRLMQSAHSELAKGRTVDALNYARHAEELASNEGVFFGPQEEHPGDLVRSIRGKMENTISQAEKVPPTNPVIMPRNRKSTIRDIGRPSQKTESTNPFADVEPSEQRFAALPQPPEHTASVEKYDSLPALENSNDKIFESQMDDTSPPSYAELQTVIVEVSDPFGGMIVESETVPPRIPTQSVQEKTDPRPIIRSADAHVHKYRGPKTIPQNVLNRLKSSKPRPADVDKIQAAPKQKFSSRIKSNRSNSQEKRPKRVNSNRGARIITTKFQIPLELDNVWHPVESKKQESVETAQMTVVVAEQTDELNPVEVTSEQPVVASHDRFFQIGGSSDDKAQAAASLVDWNAETGYKAGSQISEQQERSLIIVCIAIAGFMGLGFRFRGSLRLFWQKLASR